MLKTNVTRTIAKIGKTMAKLEISINSPFIHFQPKEPDQIEELRKKKYHSHK